ncbi:MAG: hypothetical protein CSYNP_04537 [Syntrophus sp. SKADARSKE-3]|nr:hypothetical protein [Syntrophus sp. SKADARSKE-3]
MMKRIIVMTFMVLGILQVLCISSYGCTPTNITWYAIYLDGKDLRSKNEIVVRPGQFILFKVKLDTWDWASCKVNFKFTKIESQEEALYEETDRADSRTKSQVGIHWKVDGKITKAGRYRVDIQVPYQNPPLKRCYESSNILSREVVFDPGNTPEEFEIEDE